MHAEKPNTPCLGLSQMKKIYSLALVLTLCNALFARASVDEADTIFVVRAEGKVDIYPRQLLTDVQEGSNALVLKAKDGSTFRYSLADILYYDHQLEMVLPSITSFKFNNKFNHQLFSDALCEITGDSLITGQMACIGHWATPSFKLTDKRAEVYLDDSIRLYSKYSRVKLGKNHTITAAYPDINIIDSVLTKEAVTGLGDEIEEKAALTADMLSTNAPSNYGEDPGNLLDGDVETIFHSTWGSGIYEKLPEGVNPYLEIELPEPMEKIKFSFTNRNYPGRYATGLRLFASKNKASWTVVHDFSVDTDGLPTEQLGTFLSPTIDLQAAYKYLRFEQTACSYQSNYLCWSEFALFKISNQEIIVEPAQYAYDLVPFGRKYQLQLDWLAERAGTPTIYIDVENGDFVSSKSYYLNATISFDGANIYPSMEATDVQIKGRGNSSWSNQYWAKNPYRLKFPQKMKPFGLHGGKSWVLLANKQSGSQLTNAIGHYAAGLIGADGANHIVPVDLYMNGIYWGSYNFTEKSGFSNNSIDLPDETYACMVELDTYTDEKIYRSSPYNQPVKIKEPDFEDPGDSQIASYKDVMTRFNQMAAALRSGDDVSEHTDIESLARFLFVNELIQNYEIMHPKSTFLYHENVYEDSCKWKWGPVWDLDWSYGYEKNHSYYINGAKEAFWTGVSGTDWGAVTFFKKLRQNSEKVDRAMYKYWTRFMTLYLEDIIDYIDDYYAFAKETIELNRSIYTSPDYTDYAKNAENAKKWLRQRAEYLYSKMTPYELTDEELGLIPDDEEDPEGDFLPYTDDILAEKAQPTLFDVYDISGTKLKAGATYNTVRDGLRPGLYIVNGHKMLITK